MQIPEDIKKAFETAAKRMGVGVSELKRKDFRAIYKGRYGWAIANLGGHGAIQRALAAGSATLRVSANKKPAARKRPTATKKTRAAVRKPPNPLASETALNLSGPALSKYVSDVLASCAEELGRPPHEITWSEFKGYINFRWGRNDMGIARHTITRAGGFNVIRDSYFPPKPTPIMVEKRRLQDHAKINRRLGSELAKEQFIMDRLQEYAASVFSGDIRVSSCGNEPIKTNMTLVLSDLHIGADLKKEECGVQYGVVEESRRIASIVRQTCKYGTKYLTVLLLGDIIQNWLHIQGDGAEIAEQMARAIHILSQAIAALSAHFGHVDVECATGNHGRLTTKHQRRAVNAKWASLETVIYSAVKQKCSALKNVSISIPKLPYLSYKIGHHKFFATHGDTVFDPGSGKVVAVERMETQINRINASLPDAEEYAAFIMGHIHQPTYVYTSNGACVLVNGASIPSDQYAQSLGLFETRCGQWLFTTDKHAIEALILLQVGKQDDTDETLDKVIQPWSGL